ncbi:MAG: hypothetical protein Q9213_001911 [Squamulea squamosa]
MATTNCQQGTAGTGQIWCVCPLAVSGGSDSMALAKICCQIRELRSQYPVLQFLRLHAFIVDHQARPDSAKEARQVRKWLHEQFGANRDDGLRSQILTLEWPPGVTPLNLSNFETEARRLRYRALGKACHEANIPSLLLGHHESDAKETLIMRLIEGYKGEGLRGIPLDSDIPDCQGIYGAYQSGGRGYTTTQNQSARALALKRKRADEMLPPPKEYRKPGFEFGGVRIYRPLLRFGKDPLKQALVQAEVPWVEDPTNQDPTVSIRNAIRFLNQKNLLPDALGGSLDGNRYTIMMAAQNVRRRYQQRNDFADDLFQACDIISFDSRSGSFEVRIPIFTDSSSRFWSRPRDQWAFEREHIGARLVRRLLQLVTPHDHISLQSLETATKSMFFDFKNFPPGDRKNYPAIADFTAGGVHCKRVNSPNDGLQPKSDAPYELDPTYIWRLARQPYRLDLPEPECSIPPLQPLPRNPNAKKHTPITYPEPPWQLWDGRYWIQIINSTPRTLRICPLTEGRFLRLKATVKTDNRSGSRMFANLRKALKAAAPGLSRFTLPAIVDENDEVLVLPTLGFEVKDSTIEWRIRYRRVTFPDKIKKEVVIALPEKELRLVKPPAITVHHQGK